MNCIPEDFFWSAYSTAMAIGNTYNAFAYSPTDYVGGYTYNYIKGSSIYAIIDSAE